MAKSKVIPLNNPASISLQQVSVVAVELYSPVDFDESLLQSHGYDMSFTADYDLETNIAFVLFDLHAGTLSDEEQEEEASISVSFTFAFHVEGMANQAKQLTNGEVEASDWLVENLANISQSTTRGLVMPLIQHTALRHFILPVTDPQELIAND